MDWGVVIGVKGLVKNQLKPLTPQTNPFFNYPPSSGTASCVRIAGTVMRPCYVAVGLVLIWVVCLDLFEELIKSSEFISTLQ